MKVNEVVIVGGGIAGISCAITLEENNIQATLIEQNDFVGGNTTSGLLSTWRGFSSTKVNDKFLQDVINSSVKSEISKGVVPDPSGISPYLFSYHPDYFKDILIEYLNINKVKIRLNTKVVSVDISNKKITSVSTSEDGIQQNVKSKLFIDATGNGNIATLCDVKKIALTQTAVYRIRIIGVNKNILREHLISHPLDSNIPIESLRKNLLSFRGFAESARKWFSKNSSLLRFDGFDIDEIPNSDEIIITMFAYNYNSSEGNSFSTCITNSKKLLPEAIQFLKNELPGFADCYVSSVANTLGFVNSEQLNSEIVLTDADVMLGKFFADSIGESLLPSQKNIKLQVPGKSIFVNEVSNLLVIGRTILPSLAFYKNGNPLLTMQLGKAAGINAIRILEKMENET